MLRFSDLALDKIGLSLLLVGIGGAGTWHYGHVFFKSKSTSDWRAVPGQIVDAEYTYDAAIGRAYKRFSYEYEVSGQKLNGWRVSWANTGNSGVGLFTPGAAVSVYVNPDDAQEAVLIQGSDFWTGVQILICLSVLLLGIWLLSLLLGEGLSDRSLSHERLSDGSSSERDSE